MLTWANARQFLGRTAVPGREFWDFCVFVSACLSMVYENAKNRHCFRDAEVARSNRVAPIFVKPYK